MNIAMVDPSLFTIQYDCELVHALSAANDGGEPDNRVILYGRPLRRGEELPYPIPLVRQFYVASEMLPKAVRRAAKGFEHAVDMSMFAMRMAMVRPDIVHFQWCPIPLFDRAGIALLRNLAPVVLTVHDPHPYNGHPAGIMSKGVRELLRLFDAIIVHSDWGKSEIARDGIDLARTHVVPHGPLQVKSSRREYAPGGDSFTIVFFGKIKAYKRLDTLVQALTMLPPILKGRIHLVVVGEPLIDIGGLQSLAATAGLKASWELRFVRDDEIDHWLSRADLFVFPYRDIDASGVFMSCLKYAKPVIATRIGVFREILQDGVHGYLIDLDQPTEAFTAAIASLMADPAIASRMGMEVGRLVTALPSWPRIAQLTSDIYAEARDRWQKKA